LLATKDSNLKITAEMLKTKNAMAGMVKKSELTAFQNQIAALKTTCDSLRKKINEDMAPKVLIHDAQNAATRQAKANRLFCSIRISDGQIYYIPEICELLPAKFINTKLTT